MAEAVLKLGLDPSELYATLGAVEERLKRATAAAAGLSRGGGGGVSATQRAEQESLRLAQAQARLQAVSGNLTGAQTTLQRALEGVNQESIAAIRAQTQLERVSQQSAAGWRRYAGTIREAGESLQNAGYAFSAVSARVVDLGRASVQSAVDIDRQVNVLKALTGSAEKAEARFKALVALSANSPGLTTSLATAFDAQLRTAKVTEATIDRLLPAIGRINAVSKINDPQTFIENLKQLFTQNFEVKDLRELVGKSSIGAQVITEMFNVDSPTNAKAIRESPARLAIKTADEFFIAFANAAAKNQGLANVTESLGTQFDKLRDRAVVALRPLGLEIINTLGPLIQKAVPLIEQLSAAFASLPQNAREAIVVIGALTALLGPLTVAMGAVIQSVGAFGNLAGVIGGAAGLGGAGVAVATFTALLAGAAVEVVALKEAYQANFGGLRDVVSGFVVEARAFWANYGSEIKEITQATWSFIKTNIVDSVTGVLEAVRGVLALLNGNWEAGLRALLTGASRILSLLVPSFVKAGQDMVRGLIDGIVEGSAKVRATMVALATGAMAAAKAVLGIQSPSREFFKIGEQTIDGFILGARSKAQQSAAEIRQITRAIIAAAAPPDVAAILRGQEAAQRESSYLQGFIAPSSSLAAGKAAIETAQLPKVIQDLNEALKDTPPAPPVFQELTGFAKGFFEQMESGDRIFERFGASVSRSLLNVKDLFENLKTSVKNLFFDILGSGLQRPVSGTLGSLFGGGSGGAGGNAGGGGGILGKIGSFFGLGGSGGGAFRTPSFNPGGGGSSSFFEKLSGLNFGISAPASITGGLPSLPGVTIPPLGGGGATGGILGALGLSGLFKGIGFGKTAGSGGALAGLLPLLGVSLGSSLGGSSLLGNIVGGIGGGLLGIGLTAAPAALAGSSLGFLAPLFSNPFTAAAGAAALVGALLLGRAKARKKDEATSGDSLQRAIDAIKALKQRADGGQLTSVAEAEAAFKTIHSQFIQETLQIKTKSVRESRLAHQGSLTEPPRTDSLLYVFRNEVLPAVQAAKTRRSTADKLIPEFATGYFGTREGLAYLHEREAVLNPRQQQRLVNLTSPSIFQDIGVPNAPSYAPSRNGNNGGGSYGNVVISELTVEFNVGSDLASQIVAVGGSTTDGRKVTVQNIRTAVRNGEL